MMQNKSENKIEYWQDELKELESLKLPEALKRIGESAETGDWHENSSYEDAQAQVQLIRARIHDLKLLIKKMSNK